MASKRVIITKDTSGIGNFRDLDPTVLARELASFRDEVYKKGPVTTQVVEKWTRGSIDRQRLLAGGGFGGIRWPETEGRPPPPNLAGGFDFLHQRQNLNGAFGPSGGFDTSTVETMPTPFVYDASTVDEYRVAYHFFADFFNIFSYRMRPGVPWERPAGLRPGYRFLDPYEIIPFTSDRSQTIVQPDIVVRYVPLIRVGGI